MSISKVRSMSEGQSMYDVLRRPICASRAHRSVVSEAFGVSEAASTPGVDAVCGVERTALFDSRWSGGARCPSRSRHRFCSSVCGGVLAAGTTSLLHVEAGAKAPMYRNAGRRGGGISAEIRAMNSIGVMSLWVLPPRPGYLVR